MRLNKEICKKCRNSTKMYFWDYKDDDRWKAGLLMCPTEFVNFDKNNALPKSCDYKLEHIVMEQK